MKVRSSRLLLLLVIAAVAGAAGFLTVHFWLRALKRSRRLQYVLQVLPDGTPKAAAEEDSAVPSA